MSYFNLLPLQRTYLQTGSHSEVLEVKVSTYEFGVGGDNSTNYRWEHSN